MNTDNKDLLYKFAITRIIDKHRINNCGSCAPECWCDMVEMALIKFESQDKNKNNSSNDEN